jgi:transcriptional regulator with XRE-family HTH domain
LFVGQVCNPIVEARLESGYSVTTLAKKLGVSKQYISRAEHGTYSSLNNKLITYGSKQLGIKPGVFVQRYKEFQNVTRVATVENVNPQMLARRGSKSPGNVIFVNWRSGYWNSITSFCNAFCLHPEIVRAYEDGIREEMPASMRDILSKLKILDPNWCDDPTKVQKSNPLDFLNSAQRTIEILKRNSISPLKP